MLFIYWLFGFVYAAFTLHTVSARIRYTGLGCAAQDCAYRFTKRALPFRQLRVTRQVAVRPATYGYSVLPRFSSRTPFGLRGAYWLTRCLARCAPLYSCTRYMYSH